MPDPALSCAFVPASATQLPANAQASAEGGVAPRWAVLTVTWANSLASGILWSGVPFVTERQYGFTKTQNLALALAEAAVYVVVAFFSGSLLRKLGTRGGLTPRGWLAGVFVLQVAASLVALTGVWGLIAASCILSAVGASLWPVMESYVSSGQHGGNMRRSLGYFNVTWMSATGASLLLMAPLMAVGEAQYSLLAMLPMSALSLVLLRWFPACPAPHPPEHAHTHIAPQYPYLLKATRFIIPASYVFISVIGPVLPFLLRDLALDDGMKTPLASVWMFARTFVVMALSQVTFWHARWSTLAVAVALLAGGFALTIMATSATMAFVGLAMFGAGHGTIYYAGIYYAMAVGGAEVDAGGRFEALIGLGYVIGPLAVMFCDESKGQLVGATWAAAMLGLLPALAPWFAWRRRQATPAGVAA
jgi:MFS family permease